MSSRPIMTYHIITRPFDYTWCAARLACHVSVRSMKDYFLYLVISISEPFSRCLWTSRVLIMQILPERSGKLLLIILCLLPCSVTSFECSLSREKALPSLSCPCFCRNASNQFSIGSAECKSGLSTEVHPAYMLGPGLGSLVFIIVDLAPLIVYFPVLIIFNTNLASGPGQSFLFFYHALSAAIQSELPVRKSIRNFGFWGLLTMQSPINNLLFPRTLPYIALQYCKLPAVLVAIVMTIVLVNCIHCPCASWRHPWAKLRRSVRNFREKHAQKGTVLNGLCSIGILIYGFVIQQAFHVLRPSYCCPGGANYCFYYCTELEYGRADYRIPLIVTTAVFSIVLALLLPLLLLYYPCGPALMQHVTKRSPQFVTCHKLAPVLDVFQSAYKPKLQFFAALPLLYRFVIWFLFSNLSAVFGRSDRLIVFTFVFIVILAIHSLVQPYRKPKHNYIETLYLVNLVLISMMLLISGLVRSTLSANRPKLAVILLAILTILLVHLPIVIGVGYFFWKRKCCKRCRAVCCKKVERNRRGSTQSGDLQTTSSDVYFDMGEVRQINQEDF